ncbi:MAG TPA: hypothetical protein VFT50_18200 [Baekduia sp.]|nr:hypothetical protein [Baekduia sp.]
MTTRSIVLVGIVAGLVAGTIAAIAIPRSGADHLAARAAPPAAAVPLGPATVLRVGRPLRAAGDVRLRLHGQPRVEARAKDPLGGPDWAVRVFRADRVVRRGMRRPGADPVVGRDLCAQLGRMYRGRFGWLDAAGTFRRIRPQIGGSQTWWCGSPQPDLAGHPDFATLSTITDPARSAARVKSTIAWGVAGRAARRVDVRLAGRRITPPPTPHHAFLVLADGSASPGGARAVVRYAGGRVVRAPEPSGMPGDGTWHLATRAPDPNGGLPFALTVRHDSTHGWCTATGPRAVGDRAGSVDYQLDVLVENRLSGGIGCAGSGTAALLREHPVVLTMSGGSGPLPEEGADPARAGRVARRTQPGTTILGGRAAPGVVSVTLQTPRDVRTLVPAGPAHAILAVYDGSFVTGELRIVARFRDGRTKVDTLPLGVP